MRLFKYLYAALIVCLISCAKSAGDVSSSSSEGKGGSLAMFTIAGNYVYAISGSNLNTIDISNPGAPVRVNQTPLGRDIETIYPFKNRLYIGSRAGMFVYSIDTPSAPRLIGGVSHIRSCDPVVANDTASYLTLKGGSRCGPAASGLYVYDIRKSTYPELKKIVTTPDPNGLGIADSALYVCLGSEGLKVYSLKNAYDPVEVKYIGSENYIDVIPYDDLLICWTTSGIVLHDISNRFNPVQVRKVAN